MNPRKPGSVAFSAGLELQDLDVRTRRVMVAELDGDLAGLGLLHFDPRLSERGRAEWRPLLRMALLDHDAAWLASQLERNARLVHSEGRTGPGGRVILARVPVNAAVTVAEGEFNRYYVRAVCVRTLAERGSEVVEVYRAKRVAVPRPASAQLVGRLLDARTILEEIRWVASDSVPRCGVPGGPNSGLSVRFPGRWRGRVRPRG